MEGDINLVEDAYFFGEIDNTSLGRYQAIFPNADLWNSMEMLEHEINISEESITKFGTFSLNAYGELLEQRGDLELAIEYYKSSIKRDPEGINGRSRLNLIMADLKKYESNEVDKSILQKKLFDFLDTYYTRNFLKFNALNFLIAFSDDLQSIQPQIQRYLASFSGTDYSIMLNAQFYYRMGEFKICLDFLDSMKKPTYFEPEFSIAKIGNYIELDEFDLAREEILNKPDLVNETSIMYIQALILHHDGLFKSSIELLEKINESEYYSVYAVVLTRCYIDNKDYSKAINFLSNLDLSTQGKEDKIFTSSNLALIYKLIGDDLSFESEKLNLLSISNGEFSFLNDLLSEFGFESN